MSRRRTPHEKHVQREFEEQCTSGTCRFSVYVYLDVCIASNPLVRGVSASEILNSIQIHTACCRFSAQTIPCPDLLARRGLPHFWP